MLCKSYIMKNNFIYLVKINKQNKNYISLFFYFTLLIAEKYKRGKNVIGVHFNILLATFIYSVTTTISYNLSNFACFLHYNDSLHYWLPFDVSQYI